MLVYLEGLKIDGRYIEVVVMAGFTVLCKVRDCMRSREIARYSAYI